MNRTCGDQNFFANLNVNYPTGYLELHLTFHHDDQFVGLMSEAFPSLSGWVRPEVAAEPSLCPISAF